MKFLQFMLQSAIISTLVLLVGTTPSAHCHNINAITYDTQQIVVSRTITVDKSGGGNFTTVQQAIDSVPNKNQLWTLIHLKAGIYNEKVKIPQDKQFIVLEGESRRTTQITWEAGGSVIESVAFTMLADNFVARGITFKNTYNVAIRRDDMNRKKAVAPAVLIAGDKVRFHACGFISLQDTLFDARGRHYYTYCYIEGAMDFIWGNAQSYFQGCILYVTASRLGQGGTAYITAQGRESASESTGFVFHSNLVAGEGPAFLGRAYRNYSRVVYYRTHMNNIVAPLGWNAWKQVGHEDLLTYVEVNCAGPGADKSKRVKWEKELPRQELTKLINANNFLNQDGWIEKQP